MRLSYIEKWQQQQEATSSGESRSRTPKRRDSRVPNAETPQKGERAQEREAILEILEISAAALEQLKQLRN